VNATNSDLIQLGNKYTFAIFSIDEFDKTTQLINKKCNTELSIRNTNYHAINYQIRQKINYNFESFLDENLTKEQRKVVLEQIESFVNNQIECSHSELAIWHYENIEKVIAEIKLMLDKLEPAYSLMSRKVMTEKSIREAFNYQLLHYRQLPHKEIASLASALTRGFYAYNITSFTESIQKDYKKSIELYQFLYVQTKDPLHIHALAHSQSKIDRESALDSYHRAAELGHTDSQLWLATYFGCQQNKIKANYWLRQARNSAPQDVKDISMEIIELGEPVNCSDTGWALDY